MTKTINVDVIDKSVAPKNPVNICIVNKPNPAKNCTVTESQLYRLINMPSYWVYEAGTTNIITGKNFEKYFPSSSGGGTGSANNNYQNLENKPSINGVELIGNKTTADLNIVSEKASETVSGTSKMWTTVDETTSKVTLHISTE